MINQLRTKQDAQDFMRKVIERQLPNVYKDYSNLSRQATVVRVNGVNSIDVQLSNSAEILRNLEYISAKDFTMITPGEPCYVITADSKNSNSNKVLLFNAINLGPQIPLMSGQVYNGEIGVTLSENVIYVSLVREAQVKPTPENPVYVGINNRTYAVTEELSLPLAGGTNNLNLGSSVHFGNSINVFTYVGLNPAGEVFLAASRINHGIRYADFGATRTMENYLFTTTTANLDSNTALYNCGRINVTAGLNGNTWLNLGGIFNGSIYHSEQMYWNPIQTVTGLSSPTNESTDFRTNVYSLDYSKCSFAFYRVFERGSTLTGYQFSKPFASGAVGTVDSVQTFAGRAVNLVSANAVAQFTATTINLGFAQTAITQVGAGGNYFI